MNRLTATWWLRRPQALADWIAAHPRHAGVAALRPGADALDMRALVARDQAVSSALAAWSPSRTA